jgi:tetratricopeptide (TPR) repeat protein
VVNLATLYHQMDCPEDSAKLYTRALIAYERTLGCDHPDTLSTLNNLGVLLKALDKPQSAERVFRRALDGRLAALGEAHPDTLHTMVNLANFLVGQQRHLGEAEELYSRALSACERTHGPYHPDTLSVASDVAYLMVARGKLEDACQIYAHLLVGYTKTLGQGHATTVGVKESLERIRKAISEGDFKEEEGEKGGAVMGGAECLAL